MTRFSTSPNNYKIEGVTETEKPFFLNQEQSPFFLIENYGMELILNIF